MAKAPIKADADALQDPGNGPAPADPNPADPNPADPNPSPVDPAAITVLRRVDLGAGVIEIGGALPADLGDVVLDDLRQAGVI